MSVGFVKCKDRKYWPAVNARRYFLLFIRYCKRYSRSNGMGRKGRAGFRVVVEGGVCQSNPLIPQFKPRTEGAFEIRIRQKIVAVKFYPQMRRDARTESKIIVYFPKRHRNEGQSGQSDIGIVRGGGIEFYADGRTQHEGLHLSKFQLPANGEVSALPGSHHLVFAIGKKNSGYFVSTIFDPGLDQKLGHH